MSLMDLISLSVNNLYRRKGRTLLTISGVVIGCCAVVIMISMGIGMKQSQEQMLENMGNLMRITVTPAPENASKRILLDKKAVAKIKLLSHIKSVIPRKTLDLGELKIVSGERERYLCEYITIVGILEEDIDAMGYQLTEGKTFSKKDWEVLVGGHLAYQFTDSKRPEGRNMVDFWSDESVEPYFDILKNTISIAKKKEINTGKENVMEQVESTKASWNVLQKLTAVGVLKEDYDIGDETESGLVLKMKDFDRIQKLAGRTEGAKASRAMKISALEAMKA